MNQRIKSNNTTTTITITIQSTKTTTSTTTSVINNTIITLTNYSNIFS